MDNNIPMFNLNNFGSKLEAKISQMKLTLKHKHEIRQESLKGNFSCPSHGGCGKPVSNLAYRNDALGRLILWAKCSQHGWVALPLVIGLKIPTIQGRLNKYTLIKEYL